MRLSEFVRISTPLLVPWTVQLASVYFLLLVLPRLLGPSDYSAATAALSVYLVVTAASVALQARDTTSVWATPSSEPPTAGIGSTEPRRTFSRSASVAGLGLLVATPILSVVLHVPGWPLALLAPAFFLSLLACDRIGALRRSGARSSVAIALGAGAATRVAAAVLLVFLGSRLTGILVAIVLAEAIALGVATYRLRGQIHDRVGSASTSIAPFTRLRPAIAAIASVVLVTQLDLLFAQHRLPGVEAGLYAAAAVLTRVLLFVPVIGAVLVMRRAAPTGDTDPFRWLHRSVATTGGAIIALCIALVLFRAPLTAAVLGPSFEGASALVPMLAAEAAFLALLWQLSFFHVVVESKAHVVILALAVVEGVLLGLFVHSPEGLAAAALAAAGVAAILHYVGARAVSRWSPPLTRLRPHEEVAAPFATPDGEVELSMILPSYNPGPALKDFLARLTTELEADGPNEIIVVSDGSTDDSVDIAKHFPSQSVRVIHYAERSGKGHALRVGLAMARGSYVGFIDADGDIDPAAVGPFLSLMRLYEPDIILGSKRHPMSEVNYPTLRRIMSWMYHKLTRVLFRINVRDTQTGLKVIRRDVLATVLPRMFEKRYAFDLELLVVARALGFTKVFEAPVSIAYRFSSNVNPEAVFRILLDTAAVFYRRYVLDTYRHAGDRLLLVRNGPQGVDSSSDRA